MVGKRVCAQVGGFEKVMKPEGHNKGRESYISEVENANTSLSN